MYLFFLINMDNWSMTNPKIHISSKMSDFLLQNVIKFKFMLPMKDNSRSIKRSKVFAAIYRSSVWKKGVKEEEMAGCRIAPPMCNHACDLMPLNPIISTRSSHNKNWFMVCRYSHWKKPLFSFEISSVEICRKELFFPLDLVEAFLKNIH